MVMTPRHFNGAAHDLLSGLRKFVSHWTKIDHGFSPFPSMDAPSIADRLGWRGNRDRM
jgi:hypothetical protein